MKIIMFIMNNSEDIMQVVVGAVMIWVGCVQIDKVINLHSSLG